jgi:hypothetical protein
MVVHDPERRGLSYKGQLLKKLVFSIFLIFMRDNIQYILLTFALVPTSTHPTVYR